jgi:hypothetical protein
VDQVIGRAVSDASPAPGSAAAAQERARSAGVRHNWWRIAGMTGITAVLATIAVLLQIYKPQGPPPPIDFSPSDATNVIALTETSSIGSMLYARVSPLWNQMTDQERLKQVESLGRLARDRRFEAILLVNDQGEPLAEWTTKTGAELKSPAR